MKIINEILNIICFVLNILNLTCILYFQCTSVWNHHIFSTQQPCVASGYSIGQCREFDLFIQQMFRAGPLCAKHHAGCWGISNE